MFHESFTRRSASITCINEKWLEAWVMELKLLFCSIKLNLYPVQLSFCLLRLIWQRIRLGLTRVWRNDFRWMRFLYNSLLDCIAIASSNWCYIMSQMFHLTWGFTSFNWSLIIRKMKEKSWRFILLSNRVYAIQLDFFLVIREVYTLLI
jgi:hypothetical protein